MERQQKIGKEPPKDSQFGRVEPTSALSRRSLLFVFGAAVAAPFLFFSCAYIVQNVAEKKAPVVVIKSAPKSISNDNAEIEFSLTDDDAGLQAVSVEVRQGTKRQQIFVKSYQGEKEVTERIPLKIGNQFQEGKIEVLVTAADKSLWKTAATRIATIFVDRTDPKLSIVESSSVNRQGEAGVVLYKLIEANLETTSVFVGSKEFPAWPVASISTTEGKVSDLFMALYPVPELTDDSTVDVILVARDLSGRESRMPIQKGVKPISNDRQSWDLSEAELQQNITAAFSGGENFLLTKANDQVKKVQAGLLPEDENLAIKVRLVASVLRAYDLEQLVGLIKQSAFPEPRRWKGAFTKPAGSFKSPFGTVFTLERGGAGIATFDSSGRIFESNPGNSNVNALAPGRVVYSGSLGTFGNTVVLDHGLGITTVYAGLGSTVAVPGTDLKRRDRVGTIGRSGVLKTQNGFLLMAFVRGFPIDVEQLLRSERANDSLENVFRTLRDGSEK